jgi:hypothetical protein
MAKVEARYSATDVFPHPAGPVMIQMCRCCDTAAVEGAIVESVDAELAIGVVDIGAM